MLDRRGRDLGAGRFGCYRTIFAAQGQFPRRRRRPKQIQLASRNPESGHHSETSTAAETYSETLPALGATTLANALLRRHNQRGISHPDLFPLLRIDNLGGAGRRDLSLSIPQTDGTLQMEVSAPGNDRRLERRRPVCEGPRCSGSYAVFNELVVSEVAAVSAADAATHE